MLKNATLVWICAANIILTISFSSYAQVADEQALAELEVIEVVAQKRKQDSQKVGISLSVLSSHKLSDLGISNHQTCLLYTSPSPRDGLLSRMPSSA